MLVFSSTLPSETVKLMTVRAQACQNITARHQCLIYEGAPSRQLSMLATMILRKLDEGYRCLYLNSPSMVSGLRSTLAALELDVAEEVGNSRIILSSDSPSGTFNVDIMLNQLEEALNQALADGHVGLWATGDMTWEFGAERDFSKLIEYETKLEELFQKRPSLCGICQYHKDMLPVEATRQALLTHKTIFINETLSRVNPHYMPSDHLGISTASTSELDQTITMLCQSQKR